MLAARTCISYVSCSACVSLDNCDSDSPLASLRISAKGKQMRSLVGRLCFIECSSSLCSQFTFKVLQHAFDIFLQFDLIGFE